MFMRISFVISQPETYLRPTILNISLKEDVDLHYFTSLQIFTGKLAERNLTSLIQNGAEIF